MTDLPILFSPPMQRANLAGRKTQSRRVLTPENLRLWTGGLDFAGRYVKPTPDLFRSVMNEATDFRFIEGRLTWLCRPTFGPNAGASSAVCLGRLRYAIGDRLWVKEAWVDAPPYGLRYPATDDVHELRAVKSSLLMPRWASRTTLIVTDVRVQRIQDISEEDARAEGMERCVMDDDGKFYLSDKGTYRACFAGTWDHLNAKPRARHGRDAAGRKVITHYESFPWDAGERVEEWRGKPHYIRGNPWVGAYTYTVHHANNDRMVDA